MAQIIRPPSLDDIWRDQERRIRALEMALQSAWLRVASGGNSSSIVGPLAFTTTNTDCGISSGTFTLVRPTNIMCMSSFNFYTSGGTANYGYLLPVVYDSNNVVYPGGISAIHQNGSGVSWGSPFAYLAGLPAGTYHMGLQYKMDSGATTTLSISGYGLDVFATGS